MPVELTSFANMASESNGDTPSVFSIIKPDNPRSIIGAPTTTFTSQSQPQLQPSPLQQTLYTMPNNPLPYIPNTFPYSSQTYPSFSIYNHQWSFPENLLSPNSVFGQAEQRFRHVINSLVGIVRAFGGIAQMMDSTFYAGWTLIMALGSVIEHVKTLRRDHLLKWIGIFRNALKWILEVLRLYRGNKPSQKPPAEIAKEISLSFQTPKTPSIPSQLSLITKLGLPVATMSICIYLWKKLYPREIHDNELTNLAKVLYPFSHPDPSYLQVKAGDEVTILQPVDESGWIYAKTTRDNKSGYLPAMYVRSFVDSRQ